MHSQNAFRDISGEFDHLRHFLVLIENRVVGRLDPDLLAALADMLELSGNRFARVQSSPELLIV